MYTWVFMFVRMCGAYYVWIMYHKSAFLQQEARRPERL